MFSVKWLPGGADISIDVVFPSSLYHGTLDIYLDSFRTRLLNAEHWKPNRDFGRGLYTTISIEQAKAWARSMQEKLNEGTPCVLEINISPESLQTLPNYRIFTGISHEWAKYIYLHRTVVSNYDDPCQPHADIVIGPMADADTGKIVQDGVKLKKSGEWFLDKITRNHANRRLDPMKLGNQVVFCDEALSPMLHLSGFYLYQGRRWRYNGNEEKT
ncbi:DUF3990 domain-containing protein [Cohnella sp.]|uniref:DUF3990 domain-containing protein n=1 Tax=Cohnella sp. TaxID=1883426 RepID=UPI0035673854